MAMSYDNRDVIPRIDHCNMLSARLIWDGMIIGYIFKKCLFAVMHNSGLHFHKCSTEKNGKNEIIAKLTTIYLLCK